jgi:TatD DNase family protein
MTYVDAHIHLADPGYSGKIDSVLREAVQNKVMHVVSNAVDYETSVQTIALAKQHKDLVHAAVGLHPSTVVNRGNSEQSKFEALLDENREHVSAIGEIGLDGKYSRDREKLRLQKQTFRFFLNMAEKRGLPVVVHSRYALGTVLDELSRFTLPKVLLHWFDGTAENLRLIQDRGWLISIGPALFYSKSIAQIALQAAPSVILTETDGPVPHRGPFKGKMTTPALVIDVVHKLSELKSVNPGELGEMILDNFRRLIRI